MQDLSAFSAAAILIVLAAALGYLNSRFLKLPSTVGLTVMGAVASLLVIFYHELLPSSTLAEELSTFLHELDFHAALMDGMLAFLLFAGAMHVDWSHMHKGRWLILVFSTIGVLISTVLVGYAFLALTSMLGIPIPLIWCFVFGALISPTDPVAVMGVMKRAAMPETLQATVAGESLFNDGVGIVLFSILLSIALGSEPYSLSVAAGYFLQEAGGGVLLGLVAGYIAYKAMQSIDDYSVEVMITLAVVMGGYSLALALDVSGPVAMSVAGLLIGNHVVVHAMSDITRDYLIKFWALIDELLSAVLFLLIGLEVIALAFEGRLILAGLGAIVIVMAARVIAVGVPLRAMRRAIDMGPLAFPTLVWGGLRGGISVALALSLPKSEIRTALLVATYIVVLFAVIVQGGTMGGLIRRIRARMPDGAGGVPQ